MPAEVRQQFLKIHLDKIEKKKRSIDLQKVDIRTSSNPIHCMSQPTLVELSAKEKTNLVERFLLFKF